jgi:hypothetical protein
LVSGIKGGALRVFENRVLRRIFGLKRNELTGRWRKLHNEELCNSASIIRMMNSRRIRSAGHVAPIGVEGKKMNAYRFWWEGQRDRDQ